MKFGKIVKRISITIGILIGVIALLIGLLLNVIFSPQKITPFVVEQLNNQLNAKVHCKSVALTFFASFPKFGVEIEDSYITALKQDASIDTLLSFQKAVASFDVIQYLKYRTIDIGKVAVNHATIHAFIGKDGHTNWDILKTSSTSDTSQVSADSLVIKDISIKQLEVANATLTYTDEAINLTYRVNSLSVNLSATKNEKQILFTVSSQCQAIQALVENKVVYQLKNFKSDIDFDFNKERGNVLFASKDITVNDIHFQANGVLVPKPEEHKIDMKIKTRLVSNSIDHFLSFVPSHFLPKDNIITTGEVTFDLGINGSYGKGSIPELDFHLAVNKGSLSYKNFPGKITLLETAVDGMLFPDRSKPSFIKIEKLNMLGTGVNISGDGTIGDLLNNLQVKAHLKGDLNLTELYQKFPLDSSVRLSGLANLDLRAEFLGEQLKQQKYDQLNFAGILDLKQVIVSSKRDSLDFSSKWLAMKFYRELLTYKKTYAEIKLDSTVFKFKNEVDVKASKLELTAQVSKASSGKEMINATGMMENVAAGVKKMTVDAAFRRIRLKGSYTPGDSIQTTLISSEFSIDSLGVQQAGNFVGVLKGGYRVNIEKKPAEQWMIKARIGFRSLIALFPQLKEPIIMPSTTFTLVNDDITLKDAQLNYGESDVTLSGRLQHASGFFTGRMIKASLDLQANYINTNQLMSVFAGTATSANKQQDRQEDNRVIPTDSTAMHPHAFVIPDSLQFDFTTHIAKLKMGYSDFNLIEGSVKVTDSKLYLNDFRLKTLAADLDANLVYSASSKSKADINFSFYLSKIEMNKLNEFLPLLDTLFPMTKSFIGKVDFRMKGTAELDENMSFDMNTVKGIGAMRATNINVMDGPTFRELAKTFMFKNKDINAIEQLSAEMEFEKNKVTILPALLQIDRYTLAIGGIQNLDMSYDYHISVLKSPVPFKTGVDVKGKYTDYKIKISSARYKYIFSDKERLQAKADSSVIKKKQEIIRQLNF